MNTHCFHPLTGLQGGRKRAPALLLAGVLLAGQAMAQMPSQDKPFEGFSLGLNLALQSDSTEITVGNARLHGLGWTSQSANLQGAYGWRAGDSAVLTVGANYNLDDVNSGDASTTVGGFSLKRKHGYSVYFEPGWRFSDRTLGYFKIGYQGATLHEDLPGGSVENSLDGVDYGLGLRTLLDKHTYLQAEVRQVLYNSASFAGQSGSFKTSGTLGLVGIGYQF